jgi:hypothetical protein
MTRSDALRIVAGILLGLGIAILPFLQYGLRTHHHPDVHHHHVSQGDHQ